MFSAESTNPVVMVASIDHPTARLEKRSRISARYSHPYVVGMQVMSVTQAVLGAPTVKALSSTLGAMGLECFESVVLTNRRFLRG